MQNAAKISPTNFRVTSVLELATKRDGDETARGRNGKGTKRPGTKRQGDETTIKRSYTIFSKMFCYIAEITEIGL
jgi:hypothetical protein